MPIHPAEDPPLESFGPIVPLSSLPAEPLHEGPAPWPRPSKPLHDMRTQSSPLWFGGGVFGQGMYNADSVLHSDAAVRALRLAFDYGINALDSSPYYFPSEFVLGRALRILAPSYPRDSYFLMTKCGRYGPTRAHFDYTPERITTSIRQSLHRLGTTYLDVALLHDVEFVSAQPDAALTDDGWLAAAAVGRHPTIPQDDARQTLGIAPGQAAQVRGAGDERVLAAARALFALQDEGVIRHVGMSGYPLGELLRLSRLIASHPPYRCVDVVLSYSCHTMHADLLPAWQPLFEASPWTDNEKPHEAQWTPPMLLNASPFSMGLFSDRGPPAWHPASEALLQATRAAHRDVYEAATNTANPHIDAAQVLARTALFAGMHGSDVQDTQPIPRLRTLLGMSNVDEVHAAIETYRILHGDTSSPTYKQLQSYGARIRTHIAQAGAQDQTWRSPPVDAD
ncbi:D-arabinose 1-dehydrogenase [Malassezia pachydermatis]|uniref:NADP-dependent oxidoreductase domain-containing protein n=1 Tax=Malassezia pachydermatis TaxID=77020 RepID=A0A0N0RS34_9BASI|nr:hypothetical protein Malapachy_2014 [Malassezia pachydermatis]KOS13645.1 hypothetical protein Malapachy_2014 [Malassezia pachydermatis]